MPWGRERAGDSIDMCFVTIAAVCTGRVAAPCHGMDHGTACREPPGRERKVGGGRKEGARRSRL